MIRNSSFNKYTFLIFILLIGLYVGIPRILSASSGLPYLHYWDEPVTATGALNGLKTNQLIPQGVETVYGGALRYPIMLIDYIYYQYLKLVPEANVNEKSDIKTFLDGVYHTVSHSGFYYWNRVFVSLISTLGFAFVFLIGRIRGGNTYGFIAVIILASVAMYYRTSFLVNVDIPMSVWMLGAIYFSLKFNHLKRNRDLYYSLICVGLAGATKYTGALVFLVPMTAVIFNKDLFDWSDRSETIKRVLRWCGVPLGIFILLNPIIYTYPKDLFSRITWLGWVYRTGQGHFSKEPGIEHFKFQIGEFIQSLGDVFSVLALAGFVICIVRLTSRPFWHNKSNSDFLIISLFPILYFIYVTSIYTVAFHRNFYLMYPVLALWATDTCITVGNLITHPRSKLVKYRPYINLTVIIVIFYMAYPGYSEILKKSMQIHKTIESRTKAILELNDIAKNEKIFLGINEDLLISPEDLRKLTMDYGYFDITDLNNAMNGFTHLLIPDYRFNHQVDNFDSLLLEIDKIIAANEIKKIGGNKLEVREELKGYEYPVINPAVYIIKGSEYPPSQMENFVDPLNNRDRLLSTIRFHF